MPRGLGVSRTTYVDPYTGLNNIDNILEDNRSDRLSYEEED